MFLVLAGCATHRIDWNNRISNYTFDQAVTELGPPEKKEKLTDGTVVAEWLTRRGYVMQNYTPTIYDPYHYGPTYPTVYETYSPDYYLRLTFGPDGQLRSWKKFPK